MSIMPSDEERREALREPLLDSTSGVMPGDVFSSDAAPSLPGGIVTEAPAPPSGGGMSRDESAREGDDVANRGEEEAEGFGGGDRLQKPEVELIGCCRPYLVNWDDFWVLNLQMNMENGGRFLDTEVDRIFSAHQRRHELHQ
eukprot:TRINITY_DN827_c0_g2_i1.p2 TRINITY_DN827_c0_g2~~TRINITY_DN827_c0_g2_i1.p2  ORF type:complete len:142 (-),score=35.96 TRINITY_DN827_c0_g2_i1:1514-1939(-)